MGKKDHEYKPVMNHKSRLNWKKPFEICHKNGCTGVVDPKTGKCRKCEEER